MKRITIKRVLASNSTLVCNQTVKNVGRNSRAMNIRNQVLLAINVRQWSSFKSLFFSIFSVLDDTKCRECKKLLSLKREIMPHLLLFWCLVDFRFRA